MYLGWTGWVYPRYFVHFLVMYLQCTGLVNEPLSPVVVIHVSVADEVRFAVQHLGRVASVGEKVWNIGGTCVDGTGHIHVGVEKAIYSYLGARSD